MSIIFGGVRQLGMVVRDTDAAIADWASVGVGPFFRHRLVVDDFRYRGELSPAPDLTLSFAHSGPLQIELIEQHNDVPSAYRDFLASGRVGAQHLGAWFSDHAEYDRTYADLLARGFVLAHEGASRAVDARFSYFESPIPGGLMVELAEALMPANAQGISVMEAAALNWNGEEPSRTFERHFELLASS